MHPTPPLGSYCPEPSGTIKAATSNAAARSADSIGASIPDGGLRSVEEWNGALCANGFKSAIRSIIRILIADDHAIVRAGLKEFIASEKDMVVSGEASDGRDTLALVSKGECDVVLLDLSMPGISGIDTLRQLKCIRPELPVLILSAYSEQQFAISLLRAGASGYINKESASEQLVAAIRTVISGRKYVSPSIAQVLVSDLSRETDEPLHATLSKREFQVFYRLASGVSVSRIAQELFLSVKTVSTYRAHILEKMQLSSNADLTHYAIKNHIIE
jgi:DNA-binding NarL/FixJ family response regulator